MGYYYNIAFNVVRLIHDYVKITENQIIAQPVHTIITYLLNIYYFYVKYS